MIRIIFITILCVSLSYAATLIVPSDKFATISSAVDSAIQGDTILVMPGIYKENINFSGKAILITSNFSLSGNDNDIENTIIDGGAKDVVVSFLNGEDSTSILNGFTIFNGRNYPGGGGGIICINYSSPKLENLIITQNIAGEGAGLFCYNNCNPILNNVKILQNAAVDKGAGILLRRKCNITLKGVHILENIANEDGGGIYLTDSSGIDLSRGLINKNLSLRSGGGIYADEQSIIKITNTDFSLNFAYDFGGAIFASETVINSDQVLFYADTADQGGAVFLEMCPTITFANNKFIGNRAYLAGGGLFLLESDPAFENCTVSGNSAHYEGGGIYLADASPLFSNSALNNIYKNHAGTEGNDFYSDNLDPVSIPLDTFTVSSPELYQVTPLYLFDLSITTGLMTKVNAHLYVNASTGNDSNDGLSEETALKTIFTALTKIQPDSITTLNIFLEDGIYAPHTSGEFFPVNLRSNISISANTTGNVLLDAQHQGSVIAVYEDFNTHLEQLRITGGKSNQGGGIMIDNGILSLHRCEITGNLAYFGGAMSCENNAYVYCLNTTISDNDVSPGTGTGGINIESSYLEMVNSILWNNTGMELFINSSVETSKVALAYNNIEGDNTQIGKDPQSLLFMLDGNISSDPLFIDPMNRDFNLFENSPCIDSGTENISLIYNESKDTLFIPSLEYSGIAPDMGAYEFGDPAAISGGYKTPVAFHLNQNFPNPFNPVTKISYSLPVRAQVCLEIFNILGQSVTIMVDNFQDAGNYEFLFDGSRMASGIYYYQITAGTHQAIKKMILLK